MEQVRNRLIFVTSAVALVVLCASAASAQSRAPAPNVRSTVQPSITAAVVYDDNVFGNGSNTPDSVLRVTPGISLIRVRPRAVLTAVYFLDAERYQRYSELTTPQARQTGTFTAFFSPTPRRAWEVGVGYFSTTNPTELNTLTSINVGRQRADRWSTSGMFRQQLGRQTTFEVNYLAMRDQYRTGATFENGWEARLGHRPTARTEFFIRENTRFIDFGSTGNFTRNMVSAGYGWRDRDLHWTAEGGGATTSGEPMWTAMGTLGREFGFNDITGSYGRSTTTAIGIPTPIVVDYMDVAFTRTPRVRVPSAEQPGRQPRGFRFAFRVGMSRNTLPVGEARAYRLWIEVAKPLSSTLLLVAIVDGTKQDTVGTTVFGLGGDILRNRVSLSLQFSPWSPR